MKTDWAEAQRIADVPAVHDALADFGQDPCNDSAVIMVQTVLDAARPPAMGAVDLVAEFERIAPAYGINIEKHKGAFKYLHTLHLFKIFSEGAAARPAASGGGADDLLDALCSVADWLDWLDDPRCGLGDRHKAMIALARKAIANYTKEPK